MCAKRASKTDLPSRTVIQNSMKSVVQIVALRQGLMGNYAPAWTGSGTVVDSSGIILTNCHVANPRAMGMPSPQASRLAVAVTQRSDEPPALTYFADIVVQSPELDLAVLRIVSGLDGRPVSGLNLPALAVGDSDGLELGDTLAIFGYPGIGGETVTFTSGSVSGFSKQPGVSVRRGWIKTDATIAGGNSGGTAVDHDGKLVGIPTQASAGTGITPVDARPVIDTTGDGRVDHRDTPMAIGGFINGLRPVNLAKPLLKKAGVNVTGAGARTKVPMKAGDQQYLPEPGLPGAAVMSSGPRFHHMVFSSRVTKDGRPVSPAAVLPAGGKEIFASFEYEGMRDGSSWSQVWVLDGKTIVSEKEKWTDGAKGRKTLRLANPKGLPDGEYHLALALGTKVAAEGQVIVGKRMEDTDTEVSGQVVAQASGRGISSALVIALNPGVSVRDFLQKQSKDLAYTSARTDSQGKFTFGKQLPKGQAYGLVVVAKGYRDLVIEGALRISDTAPERAMMNPIPLAKE
ncbi:MAG TPA: trypsin-like peptidase domain-containing protein [Anaerolineae bacterium]|nr:trypsin-like peptidase domain-containing protein [Anaerolineae bacterium]